MTPSGALVAPGNWPPTALHGPRGALIGCIARCAYGAFWRRIGPHGALLVHLMPSPLYGGRLSTADFGGIAPLLATIGPHGALLVHLMPSPPYGGRLFTADLLTIV